MYPTINHGTARLTSQEQKYCYYIARGIEPESALKRVGYKGNLVDAMAELHMRQDINQTIEVIKEAQRQELHKANIEIAFTKADAHMMYLEAHAKAENASEEIKAVDSMVKLHGLNAPDKVDINITTTEQLRELSDEELAKLAGSDILLSPDDYEAVDEGV